MNRKRSWIGFIAVSVLMFCMTFAVAACGSVKMHDMTVFSAKESTCTKEGNIRYFKCDDCDKLFSDAEGNNEITQADIKIAPLGHTIQAVGASEVTCLEDGYVAHYACTRCGEKFADEAGTVSLIDGITRASGHAMTLVPAKAASPTVDGNIRYYHCNTCKKNFEDSYGDTEVAEVLIPKVEMLPDIVLTLHGYKDGKDVSLDGKTLHAESKLFSEVSVESETVITGGKVTLKGLYPLEYKLTCNDFVYEMAFTKETAYTVTLQYDFATSIGNSDGSTDLSKMNDAEHIISVSGYADNTNKYTGAQLTLPNEVKNSKKVALAFTLKYNSDEFDWNSRFGAMMVPPTEHYTKGGSGGIFVSVMSGELQVAPFYGGNDGIFDGWSQHNEKSNLSGIKSALQSADGLQCKMVRNDTKIKFYYFNTANKVWEEFGGLHPQSVICAIEDKTDICLLACGMDWEFSDIAVETLTVVPEKAPTTDASGNMAYLSGSNNSVYAIDGTPTSLDKVTLDKLGTSQSVKLVVKGYKDGQLTDLSGTLTAQNSLYGVNTSATIGTNGDVMLSGVYKLKYMLTCGDYVGEVEITDQTSYMVTLQYKYATAIGNDDSGTVDMSKMNDVNHVITVSGGGADDGKYTGIQLAVPNEYQHKNKVALTFTVKFKSDVFDWNSRFGAMMVAPTESYTAGGSGGIFVSVMGNELQAPPFYGDRNSNNIFAGWSQHNDQSNLGGIKNMLQSAGGLQCKMIRNETVINFYYYDTSAQIWKEFGGLYPSTVTCSADAETDIRLVVCGMEWEFSDIALEDLSDYPIKIGNYNGGWVDLSNYVSDNTVSVIGSIDHYSSGLSAGSYTGVQLELTDDIRDSKNVTLTFTLKYKGDIFDWDTRFGAMMVAPTESASKSGSGGVGVFVMGSELQSPPLYSGDDASVIFGGWQQSNDQSNLDGIKNMLQSASGLQCKMVRNETEINFYYFDTAAQDWKEFGGLYPSTVTCSADAKTDIRLVVCGMRWEFSNISVTKSVTE